MPAFFHVPRPSKAPCPVSRARVSLLVGERGMRRNRIWDEARPNLGADTLESAPRCARLWEQMRLRLGRRTLISLREGLAARQEELAQEVSRCARESDMSVKTMGAKQVFRVNKLILSTYLLKTNFKHLPANIYFPTTRKYLATKRVHLRENM